MRFKKFVYLSSDGNNDKIRLKSLTADTGFSMSFWAEMDAASMLFLMELICSSDISLSAMKICFN